MEIPLWKQTETNHWNCLGGRLGSRTCVVSCKVRPRPWALPFPGSPLLDSPHAVVVRQSQSVGRASSQCWALPSGYIRVVEVHLVLPLDESLEMEAAVHQIVLHPKVVAGGQHLVASGASEAI